VKIWLWICGAGFPDPKDSVVLGLELCVEGTQGHPWRAVGHRFLSRCLYWCVRPITVRYRGLDGLNNKIRFLVIVGAGSPGSRCQEVVSEVPLLAV
jgi:hypothetical protein